MTPRPVLLAMNNPVSGDPEHALYPHPPGCAGHRLKEMFWESARDAGVLPDAGAARREYLRVFDRRNVLSAREWSARDAREAGARLLPQLAGRTAVVLGVQTLAALGLPRPHWGCWIEWQQLGDPAPIRYTALPHPSGRCREYNDPAMRRAAGLLLLGLYLGARGEGTVARPAEPAAG